jgi:AmmeMemoRadiSam system protein B
MGSTAHAGTDRGAGALTSSTKIRPAAVAGRFYPGDATTLRTLVDDELVRARPWTGPVPEALIVPHAGYVYSGPIAATGYATLAAARDTIHRVVLLGPAHYVGFEGVGVSSADAFATPLGDVPVDTELRDRVRTLPGVRVHDAAHGPEHSLEVHLPFLQRALADFTVLPLVVGRASAETVAAVIDAAWDEPDTIVVVSTDLSHYLTHDAAARRDRTTAAAVVNGALDEIAPDDACGAYPLRGLLTAARARGLTVELLDLRNSGDTAGARDRVVGYAAFAVVANPPLGRSAVL